MQKIKYITNRELLLEIHNSKNSYCSYLAPEYANFDVIVASLDDLTPELLQQTVEAKATKQSTKTVTVDPATINREDIVIRLMSDAHLPAETDEKRRKASSAGGWVAKTNFPPFQHFVIREGRPIEVGRSHWHGGFENGGFTLEHGEMSNRLAAMFMLLVERYSRGGSWRSYTYNDEMRSHALVQLSQVGLQFNEARSDNPFSFFTQIIKNCFGGDTKILTREYGVVPIEQVAGQDVTLLDGNGDWVKSHIYDYGIQETVNLNFYGGFEKVSIRSTMDHGWVERDTGERIETKDFVHKNGYPTRSLIVDDLRPTKTIVNEFDYRQGVVHGIIYGDGSLSYGETNFFMRVCKGKQDLEHWLKDYPKTYPVSSDGDPVYFIKDRECDLKAFPSNPGSSLDYLLGFLRGWMATDGCASDEKPRICHGRLTEQTSQATLCCDLAEYEWLKQWAPLVGWHLRGFTKLSEETNFGKRKKISLNIHLKKESLDVEDFLRSKHRENWEHVQKKTKGWSVYPGPRQTFERRMERVYCPDVQTTHTLALACGIHSFQCFRRVLNLERRAQDIRDDLLIMSGAMPSYTRQVDNEIEQRDQQEGNESTIERVKAKRGRKPKIVAID